MNGLGHIIIVGLDGCTFDVIKPWADLGILPNIAKLLDESAWGNLISTYPPLTMPAWVSFATGKDPGRFGLYGFTSLMDGSYKLRHQAHYHAQDQLELWDILNTNGLTCGILNHPLMDRPVRVSGYCVPGFMAHEVSYRTYPAELRSELDKVVGLYELDARGAYIQSESKLLEQCLRIMNKRADAVIHLLGARPVDLFLGIFTMTDRILHRFYNTYGPGRYTTDYPPDNPMAEFFQALDLRIGEIIGALGEDDFLFIISDHGFSHADSAFYINNWFRQQNLLDWKGEGKLYHLGITQKNIGRVVNKVGLYKYAQRWAPSFLKRTIPPGHNPAEGVSIIDVIYEERINWSQTKVLALSNGPVAGIYVNTDDRPEGIVPKAEKREFLGRLAQEMRSFLEQEAEGSLKVNIRFPEEIYATDALHNCADLYIDFGAELIPSGSISEEGNLFGPHPLQEHAMEGMFIANHPWVNPGRTKDMYLLDIMPTVLYLHDIPIPKGVDGRVMKEIFKKDIDLSRLSAAKKGIHVSKDILERDHIAQVVKKIHEKDGNT